VAGDNDDHNNITATITITKNKLSTGPQHTTDNVAKFLDKKWIKGKEKSNLMS